jgi:RNA polymerase sigma-70 factor, ECF subfamily
MPDEPEVPGLLALMLLIQSRRATRTTPDGNLVPLADQDRSLWDRDLITGGQAIVRQCLRRNQPGPYQIQAAINAVHSDAPTDHRTDRTTAELARWLAPPPERAAVRCLSCGSGFLGP